MKKILLLAIASIFLTACQSRPTIVDLDEDKVVIVASRSASVSDPEKDLLQAEADKGCAVHNRKAFLIGSGRGGRHGEQGEYLFSCKEVKWHLVKSSDHPDPLNPEFLKLRLIGDWKLVRIESLGGRLGLYQFEKETGNLYTLSISNLRSNKKSLLAAYMLLDKECSVDETRARAINRFRSELLAPTAEGSYMREHLASQGLLSMAISGDPLEWKLLHWDENSFLYKKHVIKCKDWREGYYLGRVIEGEKQTWLLMVYSKGPPEQRKEYEQMLMSAAIADRNMLQSGMPILQMGSKP